MILINKNVGETPLELLERIRREQPELFGADGEAVGIKLSYAGRLDPMAEGQMIILVGEKENTPEERAKFLSCDKEYVATFLIGMKTDTGDCLGLVIGTAKTDEVSEESLREQSVALKNITSQVYPWFSGKTVDGIKLFEHFKAGKTDADIERPVQKVEIKDAEFLGTQEILASELKKYIFESIEKVHGDFRQKEILEKWAEFFAEDKHSQNKLPLQIFDVRFRVSSGTFIRALTEHFDFPVTLLKLKRTAIL